MPMRVLGGPYGALADVFGSLSGSVDKYMAYKAEDEARKRQQRLDQQALAQQALQQQVLKSTLAGQERAQRSAQVGDLYKYVTNTPEDVPLNPALVAAAQKYPEVAQFIRHQTESTLPSRALAGNAESMPPDSGLRTPMGSSIPTPPAIRDLTSTDQAGQVPGDYAIQPQDAAMRLQQAKTDASMALQDKRDQAAFNRATALYQHRDKSEAERNALIAQRNSMTDKRGWAAIDVRVKQLDESIQRDKDEADFHRNQIVNTQYANALRALDVQYGRVDPAMAAMGMVNKNRPAPPKPPGFDTKVIGTPAQRASARGFLQPHYGQSPVPESAIDAYIAADQQK